jgi:acyl-CoA thioesterase FadM
MQELAWRHSESLGFDRAWHREQRIAWLVRYADLRITGEARAGETLRLATRVVGWRRVWARRETVAQLAGADVALAAIDWVLIDEHGRPARVPQVIADRFADGVPSFQPGRVTLTTTPPDASVHAWRVSIRDLDPMAHVNNATYLDVLDEALAAGTGAPAGPPPPVRYEVEYLRPALPRTTASVVLWDEDGAVAVRYLGDDDGELARARMTTR